MTHNDVLRSLRYTLDANDARIAHILTEGGRATTAEEAKGFLTAEGSPGHVLVDDLVMGQFLNGLIAVERGRDPARPAPPLESVVTNNVVLKKLRVAYELKDADLHAVFASADCAVTKPELSAFFRKPDNSHYRACGDQYLRGFLKGLSLRFAKRPRP